MREVLTLAAAFALVVLLARLGLLGELGRTATTTRGLLVGLLGVVVGYVVGGIVSGVPRAREVLLLMSAAAMLLIVNAPMSRGDEMWLFFCASSGALVACLDGFLRSWRHLLRPQRGAASRRRIDAAHPIAGPKLSYRAVDKSND